MKKSVKELRKELNHYRLERFKDVLSDDIIVDNCMLNAAETGCVFMVPAILLIQNNPGASICIGVTGGVITLAAGALYLAKGFKDSPFTKNIKLTKNEIKGKIKANKQKVLK